jgi:hypothetical protein
MNFIGISQYQVKKEGDNHHPQYDIFFFYVFIAHIASASLFTEHGLYLSFPGRPAHPDNDAHQYDQQGQTPDIDDLGDGPGKGGNILA